MVINTVRKASNFTQDGQKIKDQNMVGVNSNQTFG
jgi:hypothetical protein